MTRLAGELRTGIRLPDALTACGEAIDGLGLNIETVQSDRIVSRSGSGAVIEVELSESEGGTVVRIIGNDSEAKPLSRDALLAELEPVREAIEASLASAAPIAQGPPRRDLSKLVAAGLIGLVAIGVAIVAIALVNDDDDSGEGGRNRAGIERDQGAPGQGHGDRQPSQQGGNATDGEGGDSAGTSPSDGSQGSQGSPESSTLGLGDAAEIRDGDEHFELTPTDVARDGSFITLEFEITGLGGGGYDPAGRQRFATLFGSNGRSYNVDSDGPGGCEPPPEALKGGETADGCLPFKVPEGVDAEAFRYVPFFIGDDRVTWSLE
jgi:hypothetical protein